MMAFGIEFANNVGCHLCVGNAVGETTNSNKVQIVLFKFFFILWIILISNHAIKDVYNVVDIFSMYA